MKTPTIAVLSAAAAIALGVLVPACDSKDAKAPASSSTTTSAAGSANSSAAPTSGTAAPTDYTNLLVPLSDLQSLSNDPLQAGQPATPTSDTPGVDGTFRNAKGDNTISINIAVLADPAAAVDAMNGTVGTLNNWVIDGNPQPVAVGNGGTVVVGTSPDKSKAVTLLVFTEGKASVTLHFEGPPGDAAPVDFATAVAQKQDATIKKNLPA